MNSLISNLSKSFSKLQVSNINSGNIIAIRQYTLVLDSVDIPKEIEIKHRRAHRDQPTRQHKLLVKRQHQAKINVKRQLSQRSITDWRLAPAHHLPKFDPERQLKQVKQYTGTEADNFQDVPFGYKQRKHAKLLENQQEEKKIYQEIKEKRLKRHIELITKEKERKEAFNLKMSSRINNNSTTVESSI